MTFRKRLSSKAREELYDRECAAAFALGRGELPICNICNLPVNGATQAWDESHDPAKPRWLGGTATAIAHRRCNREHNNRHDTPLFAKSNRQRQRYIGAKRTTSPMPGGRDDRLKQKIGGAIVMTTWILIIWMTSGGSSEPAIPVRVDDYKTQVACNAAAEVWRGSQEKPGYASKIAVCLPGGRWTGIQEPKP